LTEEHWNWQRFIVSRRTRRGDVWGYKTNKRSSRYRGQTARTSENKRKWRTRENFRRLQKYWWWWSEHKEIGLSSIVKSDRFCKEFLQKSPRINDLKWMHSSTSPPDCSKKRRIIKRMTYFLVFSIT
jgi:hypothetical protein